MEAAKLFADNHVLVFFFVDGLMEDWFQPNERTSLNKEFTNMNLPANFNILVF